MKEKPIIFLSIAYVLSILVFGTAVRNFELPVYLSAQDIDLKAPTSTVTFNNFQNALWCMVLVMTTVGYGDIYPVTMQGRALTVFACIWGSFIVSMLIVSLTALISFSGEEQEAFDTMIDNKTNRTRFEREASELIRSHFEVFLYRKSSDRNIYSGTSLKTFSDYLSKRNIAVKNFTNKCKIIRDANPELTKKIESLSHIIDSYKEITLKRESNIVKSISPILESLRSSQTNIDIDFLALYDCSIRLSSFIRQCNKRMLYNIDDFSKMKEFFDPKGNKLTHYPIKKYLEEFFNAREPFYFFYTELYSHLQVAIKLRNKYERSKLITKANGQIEESGRITSFIPRLNSNR